MTITISELRIHPVKGFKRIMVETIDVTKTGPLNDRRFMLIDDNNHFLSQRTHPKMAIIGVSISSENELNMSIPGYDPLILPQTESEPISAVVWKDSVTVVEWSQNISQALSEYLQISCRLVAMAPNAKRMVAEQYSTGDDEVQFADGFPFLLASQASLDDLNTRLDVAVPMDRFRPNIVITGCAPYEEDQWKSIQIGEIIFDFPKPCSRCTVTTVDQETGIFEKEKGKNPLKALSLYRNTEKGILFGQDMTHRSTGKLQVGQSIIILERHEGN